MMRYYILSKSNLTVSKIILRYIKISLKAIFLNNPRLNNQLKILVNKNTIITWILKPLIQIQSLTITKTIFNIIKKADIKPACIKWYAIYTTKDKPLPQ